MLLFSLLGNVPSCPSFLRIFGKGGGEISKKCLFTFPLLPPALLSLLSSNLVKSLLRSRHIRYVAADDFCFPNFFRQVEREQINLKKEQKERKWGKAGCPVKFGMSPSRTFCLLLPPLFSPQKENWGLYLEGKKYGICRWREQIYRKWSFLEIRNGKVFTLMIGIGDLRTHNRRRNVSPPQTAINLHPPPPLPLSPSPPFPPLSPIL